MDENLDGLLQVSRRGDETLTQQLIGQVRSLVLGGRLKPGQRLPASRVLARSLGIARNIVAQAFEQLSAEGYLQLAPRQRPIVAEGASGPGDAGSRQSTRRSRAALRPNSWALSLADQAWPPRDQPTPRAFQPGLADSREFPHDVWGRCLRRAAVHAKRQGREADLQQVLLAHLADHRGVTANPDQVLVLPTAQAGIALVARVMMNAGDVAWIESPGYGGAMAALRATGAEVIGMPTDRSGIVIDESRHAPRLIFVTPSHHYPTGRLMPIGRRSELLRFAKLHNSAIIEDDYDGEFHYDGRPVAALAGLSASSLVFYLGTFAKTMNADIRVGYVIVPEMLVEPFRLAQRHLGLLVSPILQAALADFVGSGRYRAHVRKMTRLYRARRDRLLDALAREAGQHLSVERPAGGMQLLARCHDAVDDVALCRRLQGAGVVARPLSAMLYHPSSERGLFLGFAAWNDAEIDAGAAAIGRLIRREPKLARTLNTRSRP